MLIFYDDSRRLDERSWNIHMCRSVLTHNTTHTYLCIIESIKRVAEAERFTTSLKSQSLYLVYQMAHEVIYSNVLGLLAVLPVKSDSDVKFCLLLLKVKYQLAHST